VAGGDDTVEVLGPRPVPLPIRLVVKSGKSTCVRCSARTPPPLSATEILAHSASAPGAPAHRDGRRNVVKLHLFSGFEKRSLGITPDMELGHLYDDGNSRIRLAHAAAQIGVGRRRAQVSKTGLVHYDLWGPPLARAKTFFPIVSGRELVDDMRRIKVSVRPAKAVAGGGEMTTDEPGVGSARPPPETGAVD
jgi:hypothetical protein